jgi:phytol kinase
MLPNNFIAMILTFASSVVWLRINDFAAHRGWIESRMSRKIIHIGTGPIFVLCWLLFNPSPEGRWLASLVPLLITVQFVLVGMGILKDEAAVKAMSRSGDRREILKGPLFYGIIFVAVTLVFWKDSPVGITALMIMCGGDGLADIVGRSRPLASLPWNRQKSLGGSLSVFIGGYVLSAFILGVFTALQVLPGPWPAYLSALVGIALISTLVESLPLKDVDNITVSLAAIISGLILF